MIFSTTHISKSHVLTLPSAVQGETASSTDGLQTVASANKGHTLKELCGSPCSLGPDFISLSEGVFKAADKKIHP
jgi:hypothetical protein